MELAISGLILVDFFKNGAAAPAIHAVHNSATPRIPA
jgi:hypothetical protein